jgi:hypothetical protein
MFALMKSPTSASNVIVSVCAGTPAEMGFAQGSALKEKIRHARVDVLTGLEAFRLQQPRWMPFWAYRWCAEWKASHFLAGPLLRDCPEMSQRMVGIARGSGLNLKSIHLFNALEPLLSSVGDCTSCPGACSAIAVRGRRSTNGEAMIARNFDYLPLVQPYYIIRDSRPKSRKRAIEFTTAPLAGSVDGMNETGLTITYNYAFTTDQPKQAAPPISMLISEALEQCSTVTEAAKWITSRPRWGGGLLMLADADGDIASLELSSSRSHLRRPPPGEDMLFHSNAASSACMREVEAPRDAVYNDRAPTPLRGRRLHESSEMRDRRFAQLLGRSETFSADDLAAIMADHGPDGVPGDHTPCVHSAYWQTTAVFPQITANARGLRFRLPRPIRGYRSLASIGTVA